MPVEPIQVPDVPWGTIAQRLDTLWIPEESPHISITGLTGSGKSYLVRHGILPLVKWDKVLIIDVKGGDRTLAGLGKPVRRIPTWQRTAKELFTHKEPMGNWYRLTVFDDIGRGQLQVAEALKTVWNEGEWIVIVDELRALVDTPANYGLGLRGWWSRLMMRGRSKGIAVVNQTQEPAWVPGLFYTQPSFSFVGKLEDERAHKRISEIGASRGILPVLPGIPKRRWLFMDNEETERFYALTGLT